MLRRNNQAQSFTEFAFLIVTLAAVIIAMRVFMVRAVQDRFRKAADVFGQGEQYDPDVTIISNVH